MVFVQQKCMNIQKVVIPCKNFMTLKRFGWYLKKHDHNLGLDIIMKPGGMFDVEFHDGTNFGDIWVFEYVWEAAQWIELEKSNMKLLWAQWNPNKFLSVNLWEIFCRQWIFNIKYYQYYGSVITVKQAWGLVYGNMSKVAWNLLVW